MTKTVKEIVDMYLNRQKNLNSLNIWFITLTRNAGYSNIVNLFQDGIKIEILKLDKEMHEYEFDYHAHSNDRWIHVCFIGKIAEFSYDVKVI